MNNPSQPEEQDAVLANQNQEADDTEVLDSLETLRATLNDPDYGIFEILTDAWAYGEAGLNLVIVLPFRLRFS